MPLQQSHAAMLKRFMKEELFDASFKKKSYVWDNIEKKLNWAGGVYEVPVKQQSPTTAQMGSLAATNDIAEFRGVVGTISAHKELTMTALFREADLARHSYSEQTYLEMIPEMVDDLTRTGVEQMEAGFFKGAGVISLATANGTVGGAITVADPEYFQPGMKVEVVDNDTGAATGYVRTVDINTGVLSIFNARTAGAAVDLSLFTTAQAARVRMVGAGSEAFLDLRTALLPASLGGADSIYGLTKADHLPLQAKRATGAAYTANTILKDLLKEYFQNRKLGRGEPSEIWVNYGMFANMTSGLETARQYMVKEKSAGYGFQSVELVGNEGAVKIVALRHLPTDIAVMWDWKAAKFAGLPMKKNLYGEAGQEYFVERATTGVNYISDIVLRGDFVIQPGKLGIVHSIPASVSI